MRCKNLKIDYLKISLDHNMRVKEIKSEALDVIGQNKDRMVIDDAYFTTLDREKARRGSHQFNPPVGHIHITDYTKDSYFRDRWGYLIITVYHFGIRKKILQNRINKEVNAYIQSKIGVYLGLGSCRIEL